MDEDFNIPYPDVISVRAHGRDRMYLVSTQAGKIRTFVQYTGGINEVKLDSAWRFDTFGSMPNISPDVSLLRLSKDEVKELMEEKGLGKLLFDAEAQS